jgi:ATPase subunit of ABC transporter with duplicated ATPase domains
MAPARATGEGQGAPRRYEKLLAEGRETRIARPRSRSPRPPRLGGAGRRGHELAQGLSAIAADRATSRSTCPPGGIVGVIGPNGAGKTTLFA